jgi:hypothetical protein
MPLIGKIAGAFGLAAASWLWAGWGQAVAALAGAEVSSLTLGFAAAGVGSVTLSAWRWQGLLARIGVRPPFGSAARLHVQLRARGQPVDPTRYLAPIETLVASVELH